MFEMLETAIPLPEKKKKGKKKAVKKEIVTKEKNRREKKTLLKKKKAEGRARKRRHVSMPWGVSPQLELFGLPSFEWSRSLSEGDPFDFESWGWEPRSPEQDGADYRISSAEVEPILPFENLPEVNVWQVNARKTLMEKLGKEPGAD